MALFIVVEWWWRWSDGGNNGVSGKTLVAMEMFGAITLVVVVVVVVMVEVDGWSVVAAVVDR